MNPLNANIDIKTLMKGIKATREKGLRKEIKSEKVIQILLKSAPIELRLLVLYYLGDLESLKSIPNTKSSIVLSIIVNSEGFENLRKMLSNLEAIKTKENLIFIRDLFKEVNLTEFLTKVKKDLLRIKK